MVTMFPTPAALDVPGVELDTALQTLGTLTTSEETSRGTATSLPRSSVWRILTETGSPMEWNSVWILPDTTYRLSVNLSPPIHLTPNWSISWKGKVCWEGPSDIRAFVTRTAVHQIYDTDADDAKRREKVKNDEVKRGPDSVIFFIWLVKRSWAMRLMWKYRGGVVLLNLP